MTEMNLQVWKEEPDEMYFEISGYKCAINRVEELGHLCGYVGVNEARDYETEIDVHGGITFDQSYDSIPEKFKEHFEGCEYVIGFDCAHYMDLVPAMPHLGGGGTYKDIRFVHDEIHSMVKQLKEMGVRFRTIG